MTRKDASRLALAALATATLLFAGLSALPGGAGSVPKPATRAVERIALQPLSFEPAADGRSFVARGDRYAIATHPRSWVVTLNGDRPTQLRAQLLGATETRGRGAGKLRARVNYLLGADRTKWRTDVPTFRRVAYGAVYDRTDLVFHGHGGALEYDFRLRPGASPGRIAIRFSGARRLRLAANGDLVAQLADGSVTQRRPVAYQMVRGVRRPVRARFALAGSRVSFHLGAYDHHRPLVIDPSLAFGDYIGGTGSDVAQRVALDSAGNVYIAGLSSSASIPGFNVVRGRSSGIDAFVMKLSPSGERQWISYIGGTADDIASAIALDASGRIYITGWTESQGSFPASNDYVRNAGGERDAYIARLTPAGGLDYAKFFVAASTADFGIGIAAEGGGAAYLTVSTFDSPTNPTTSAGYLTRYDSNGVAQWTQARNGSTSDTMTGVGIAPGCSSNCDVFVTGRAICPASICGTDTQMSLTERYNASDVWQWGYYWSTPATPSDPQHPEPSGGEAPNALAVDSHGNPAIIGTKYVTGHNYAFAARFDGATGNPDPVLVTWQTGLLNGDSNGWDIAYDSEDNLLFSTSTASTNDDTKDAIQTSQGSTDGQVVKYFPDGYPGSQHPAAEIVWNTYLGGTSHDYTYGIATAPGGVTYAVGETTSGNFLSSPLSQPKATASDGYLVKIRTNSATITDGPTGTIASRDVTFKYESHETSGSFQCRLAGSGSPMPDFGACGALSQDFKGLPDGAYKFEIKAFDEGHTTNGEIVRREFAVDTAPHASFKIAPNPVLAGRAVTFDGSGSSAATAIAKYEWDLNGDGQFETQTGTTSNASQVYPTPGTVKITLRITDSDGKTATASDDLHVNAANDIGTQFGVTIDNGAQFTNDPHVTVTSAFPVFTTGLLFSNDGGFGKAQQFAAKKDTPWLLDSSGPERLPKTIYVRFLTGVVVGETHQDDIILDEIPPKVDQAVVQPATPPSGATAAALRKYRVKLKAHDSNSGVALVQLTANKKRPGKALEYRKKLVVQAAKRPKWVRARDRAGNWSKWKKTR